MKIDPGLLNSFSPPNFKNSYFITFEGIEGSGKSTQIHLLKEYFEKKGFRVILTREPGGTLFGEQLRNAILKSSTPLHPIAEAHLFAAARMQLLKEVILKELESQKTVVLCDRYLDSSLAYQGMGRGLGFETVLEIHKHYPLNTVPHLTFYLKISLELSLERQNIRNQKRDYFESEKMIFHKKVFDGYNLAAEIFDKRIVSIDGSGTPEEVFTQMKSAWEKIC